MSNCDTCRFWGEMGKCEKQSVIRTHGDLSWYDIVTTKPKDTCDAALAPFTKGQNDD